MPTCCLRWGLLCGVRMGLLQILRQLLHGRHDMLLPLLLLPCVLNTNICHAPVHLLQLANFQYFLSPQPGEHALSLLPPWHIYERTVT